MISYRKTDYQRRNEKFLLLIFFLIPGFVETVPRSIFTPRAQQTNVVHDFIVRNFDSSGILENQFDISLQCSYHHSFQNSRIADMIFGASQLRVSGSTVEGRLSTDLLADFFGLSQNFQSTIT